MQSAVLAISLLIQVFISDIQTNPTIINSLKNHLTKNDFKVEKDKLELLDILGGYQLDKNDTIPCLGGASPFELQKVNIVSETLWNNPKIVSIDKFNNDEEWSEDFIETFGSNSIETSISDLIQISNDYYVMSYKTQTEVWLDLFWMEKDTLNFCTITYSVFD